ncbi:MAG: helix-hairpin-helix domain-containing protein [Erythrobacter sp.]
MSTKAPEILRLGRSGSPVRLGSMLAQGGEGRVHRIVDDRQRVAKLYKQTIEPAKARKLQVMAARAASAPSFVAWPQDVILDGTGRIVGFVMPAVANQDDIHELYGPKSREAAFPEADFRFLVHVAGNVARAFAAIHAQQVVIGDVNPGGILVSPQSRISLIDADSFQISDGDELFTCDVGVATFTPPELQGKPFRGLRRTQNHDLFGLAVILFHLLIMGRHPYVGRFGGAGDMPIERAIREHRYAYGEDSQGRWQMRPPPGSVLPTNFGKSVAACFAEAFRPEAAVAGRPDATRWIAVLDQLENDLVACPTDPSHYYLRALKTCTWCRLEKIVNVRLFGVRRAPAGGTRDIDIADLWAPIAAITPPPDPVLPQPTSVEMPSRRLALAGRAALCSLAIIAGLALVDAPQLSGGSLVLVGVGVGLWPGAPWLVRSRAFRSLEEADRAFAAAVARFERDVDNEAFVRELDRLETIRQELQQLPLQRANRINQLTKQARERQLQHFLDRCRLDRARIEGIGPGRLATLASYGIETASGITHSAVLAVPGFGSVMCQRLLEWRATQERRFQFDPRAPADPQDLAKIDRSIEQAEQRLAAELRDGPRRLRAARDSILRQREALIGEVQQRYEIREKAAARYRAI